MPVPRLSPAEKQKRDDVNFLPASFRHCLNVNCLNGEWNLCVEEEATIFNVMFQEAKFSK